MGGCLTRADASVCGAELGDRVTRRPPSVRCLSHARVVHGSLTAGGEDGAGGAEAREGGGGAVGEER